MRDAPNVNIHRRRSTIRGPISRETRIRRRQRPDPPLVLAPPGMAPVARRGTVQRELRIWRTAACSIRIAEDLLAELPANLYVDFILVALFFIHGGYREMEF